MSLFVRAAPADRYSWLTERLGLPITPGFRAIEAVDEATGATRGMVGFDFWTRTAVHVHAALEAPIVARALLLPAFRYAFEECGKRLMLATVCDGNTRSVAFVRHMGFEQTHRVRDGWDDGVDLLGFELRKENCRWRTSR